MDRAQALEALAELVQARTTQPALSDAQLGLALDGSLIPDAAGVLPGGGGYVATFDLWWAAAETAVMRHEISAMQPNVKRWTSEGTTVERTQVDWLTLARSYRAKSPMGAPTGAFTELVVGGGVDYTPRSADAAGAIRQRGVIGNWS